MKITYGKKQDRVTFQDLSVETIFEFKTNIYMKVSQTNAQNAYNFTTKDICCFNTQFLVEPIDSELILNCSEPIKE